MADVTLKISIGTFMAEVAGPQEYADKKLEELISKYLTSSPRTVPSEKAPAISYTDATGKRTSAAEFLKSTTQSNQTDRAIVLGYFLEHVESRSSFTTTELGELGKQTKNPFTNISDSVGRLVARGLMMSAGEKDGMRAYALTASGEAYLESIMSTTK